VRAGQSCRSDNRRQRMRARVMARSAGIAGRTPRWTLHAASRPDGDMPRRGTKVALDLCNTRGERANACAGWAPEKLVQSVHHGSSTRNAPSVPCFARGLSPGTRVPAQYGRCI
jgi:hypothetical protein